MIKPEHYPYKMSDTEAASESLLRGKFQMLSGHPFFKEHNRTDLMSFFSEYLNEATHHFSAEEKARKKNVEGANLYYHGKPHAVYQVGFDIMAAIETVIHRNDKLTGHLAPEGAFAAIIGSLFHDLGYVYKVPVGVNFAARTNIHVDESIKALFEIVDKIGVPDGMDKSKIKILGALGIHRTNFPYTKGLEAKAREVLDKLPPELRKEAQIVRLLVQIADLGGQCSRVDYFPEGLKELRKEMNAATPGQGTQVLGEDHDLTIKVNGFINSMVDPTVGKTGRAILKKEGTRVFQEAWPKWS